MLNIPSDNYSYVSFRYDNNGKIYANIEGANKWKDYVSCGNYDNINLTDCIIVNGLMLYLDAGNLNSYSGSGTTWNDLSNNGNNGTLVNEVGFNSSNGGSLVFDGVNDYVDIGNFTDYFPSGYQSHNLTVDIWVKVTGNLSTNEIFSGALVNTNNRLYFGKHSGYWEFGFGTEHWFASYTGSRAPVTSNWTHYVLRINNGKATLFINGIEKQSKTDTSVLLSGKFPIGGYFYTGAYNDTSGSNRIGIFKVYNRALAESEIQQNFNAHKNRYGL